ncbi:MAG: metal ABC transporter substrate-binding protein [Acidimicrobiales bacterium]
MLLIIGWAAVQLAAMMTPAATAASDDRPAVVATTSIWADIVARVDCTDRFDVEALVPVGADAHSYEPSMQDRQVLEDAALIVANGGDLEEQLHDTLDVVADEGTPLLEVFDHVTTAALEEVPTEDGTGHAEDEHGEHGGDDPHVWFDPTLVIEAAPVIGDALVAAGADEAETAGCVAALTESLGDLDAEVAEILSVVPAERRLLVTNHDALGYFARHYGFEILGSVLPGSSTLSEASPAELAELSTDIEEAGVPAIFAEALESADEATALADRLGVEVVALYTDSLGEEGSGAETYIDLMRFDAAAIAGALGE